MSDFTIIIIFFVLLIAGLFIERHFYTQQVLKEKDRLLEELSRATKAVISKNANEYVMTASIDKVAPEKEPPVEPDLIPEETLSDDEFMKSIGKQLEKPKEEEN